MPSMGNIFDKIIDQICFILGFDPDSLDEEFPDDPYVIERRKHANKNGSQDHAITLI